MASGLRPWHLTCPSCSYEGSTLKPHILDQVEGGELDEVAREIALRALRQGNFKKLAAWIGRLVPTPSADTRPSLLDVGCAHGWFLREMLGVFRVTGIEPDQNVANAAAGEGLAVRSGFFPDVLRAGESYDVITFNDVLEHIPAVGATLDACLRHLSPGGLLVVNAPDRRGFLYRVSRTLARCGFPSAFDRLWQAGFPSPHVHYFDAASIGRIANRHGFRLIEIHRLPAVTASGLYSRIRFSRASSVAGAAAITMMVGAAIPLLRLLPSDITVWIFKPAP